MARAWKRLDPGVLTEPPNRGRRSGEVDQHRHDVPRAGGARPRGTGGRAVEPGPGHSASRAEVRATIGLASIDSNVASQSTGTGIGAALVFQVRDVVGALALHPTARRLRISFDAQPLQADLHAIDASWWAPHRGPYHNGGWESVSLCDPGGDGRAPPLP